ncbi:MAG: hypothetical protein ABSF68_02245 [Candidatus Acidiferrales bacterium]
MPGIAARATEGPSLAPRTPFLERQSFAAALLYLIQLLLILALVFAANRQGLLMKEEASVSFVNPTFLSLRLQHHVYATSFYAYVLFLWAAHFFPTLFFGRFTKAAIMALLAPLVYLYLMRRFSFSGPRAFAAALSIGLLPGVICFSWFGVDVGLETPLGFLALWLALFESPLCIVASCVAVCLAAGCYGSGLAFLPAVLIHQLPRLRTPKLRSPVIAGSALAAAVLAFPILWWTNIQSLWIGGGGRPLIAGAAGRLAGLFRELFVHGGSYYFFADGAAALGGIVMGLAALAGLVVMSVRQPSRCWPLLVVSAGVVGMYAVAGNITGVRRAIPLVVCLGIFAALLMNMVPTRKPFWRALAFYVPMILVIALEGVQFNDIRSGLATSRIALPHDFEFRIPPGKTMAQEITLLVARSETLPSDLAGYEPDRTLCVLYRLTQPNPIVSAREIIVRCDQHGWSIPSTSPRFSRLRQQP